jgi:predicted dehydrogenase
MGSGSRRPLNLAFLGCGFATRLHSKTLSRFGGEVRCFYGSRSRDKARAYNEKHRGCGFFDSYTAAIEAANIDVVFVATPPARHLDLALQAMRAGKDVIVEKPPVLRLADFGVIREVQSETGRRVLVAENYFYKPLAERLRRIIRENLIGDVLFLHVNALKDQPTDNWRADPDLSGGGALFEGGVHWVNFVANLGFEIEAVHGFRAGGESEPERSVLVTIEYAEGVVGTLHYSWEVPSLFKGLRLSKIYGRDGSISFESNGLFILVSGARHKVVMPGLSDIAGYTAMFRDFIQALRSGKEPRMTLDLAERDLEVVEAIYRSIAA